MKRLSLYTPAFLFLLVISGQLRAEAEITSPDWTFYDDFEGSLDTDFWASKGASNIYGESCPGSSKHGESLVFKYIPGEPESGHGWSERRFNLPVDAVQLTISYDLFVPSNYVHTAGNHKNFVLWSGKYGKANANVSVSSESWPADGGGSPSVYIGVDGKNHGHSMVDSKPLFMEDAAGEWMSVHIFLDLAEHDGDYGTFELYKDGEIITANKYPRVITYSDTELAKQISYSSQGNFIDQGYLMGWANGGFAEETVFCIDNFSIEANAEHKETIGEAAGLRPNPPIPR